jgi:hypothetical protein
MTAVPQQPDDALDILKRLEPAIAGLASRLTAIESRLTAIEVDLVEIRIEVAELRGRVSQLPTSWMMFTAIVVLIFTVMGGTFGILKMAGAIP